MQLRNNYAEVQQTYPYTVQKSKALLTAWEGEKTLVHGSNEELSFANFENDNNSNRVAAGKCNTQASGGRASHINAAKTCRCYYCKK